MIRSEEHEIKIQKRVQTGVSSMFFFYVWCLFDISKCSSLNDVLCFRACRVSRERRRARSVSSRTTFHLPASRTKRLRILLPWCRGATSKVRNVYGGRSAAHESVTCIPARNNIACRRLTCRRRFGGNRTQSLSFCGTRASEHRQRICPNIRNLVGETLLKTV